jgi:endonuclease-8
MPEGDTVWRTARRLDQALSGRALTESDFRVPRWAHLDLVGQTVDETVSRGKHILTRLPELTVHTHLKMEGSWHVYRPTSRWREPGHRARLILGNDQWRAVGFQLGTVDVVERDAEHTVVGHLGPDILGTDWSSDEAARRVREHPGRPIVEALLDQRNLAGIGNLYAIEASFLFGLHPSVPVGDVPALESLLERTQQMMRGNLEHPEQTTTGDRHRGREHWVYGRAGKPCRRCGTRIASGRIAWDEDRRRREDPAADPEPDRSRLAFWCPSCQPAPS